MYLILYVIHPAVSFKQKKTISIDLRFKLAYFPRKIKAPKFRMD